MHYFCPNISPFLQKTSRNVATCLLSAQPGLFVLSTRGDIQQPVMVGRPQASVMWLSAPPPAQAQSHHRGVGWRHKRRRVQAEPQHRPPPPHQSSGNLAASDCKYLRVAGRPWCYWQLITGSIIQKEEKKNSGWSRSLDVGNVRVCTHLSLISFFCTQTHLADRIVYYAADEFGRSGCTRIYPNSVWMKG